jgi:oligopeptide/dipeptide ABC transporter ATP-binding protein
VIAMVFQSYALYPHLSVLDNIAMPLRLSRLNPLQRLPGVRHLHGRTRQAEMEITGAARRVAGVLRIEELLARKPRQLSGGQKQRIGIARAFGGKATVIVADEPVSALDVSVQAAITGLLTDIQRKKRTTMIFISHDLSVVRYLADRVVVMYLGHIMEQGTVDQVFAPPYHPYTEALLSAVPIADTSVKKKRIVLKGELPSPINPPTGCPFQTRCHRKIGAICETQMPPERDMGNGHRILCHLPEDVLRDMEPVIAFGRTASEAQSPMRSQPAAPALAPGKG